MTIFVTSDNACQDLQNVYGKHHNAFVVKLTDNFLYQGQFLDTDTITRSDQRKNFQNADK
jgi:hypothetical protein